MGRFAKKLSNCFIFAETINLEKVSNQDIGKQTRVKQTWFGIRKSGLSDPKHSIASEYVKCVASEPLEADE